MNFTDAVRELFTNNRAEAIEFKSNITSKTCRIIMKDTPYTDINFPYCVKTMKVLFIDRQDRKGSIVLKANCPEFILREDFKVIYKTTDIYTIFAAGLFEKKLDEVTQEDRKKAKVEFYKLNYSKQQEELSAIEVGTAIHEYINSKL